MNNAIKLKFTAINSDTYKVEYEDLEEIREVNVTAFDQELYDNYQQARQKLYSNSSRISLKSTSIINRQEIEKGKEEVKRSADQLLTALNDWFGSLGLTEKIKEATKSHSSRLPVTIMTKCEKIRKLPLHELDLLRDSTEIIFSGIEAKKIDRVRHPERIQILVILGDTTGIDVDEDKKAIEDYCQTDAKLEFLAQPSLAKLTTTLKDTDGWDIIFFSGHSYTGDDANHTGYIQINHEDTLTIAQIKDVLEPAIRKRVQIMIFNSCDGLGIASDLEQLDIIDRLIVMREPIPDRIAQEFLKGFLKAFTEGDKFDDAVRTARNRLDSEELQKEYPHASWLPIVIQNPFAKSPTWQSLGKIRSPYKGLERFTEDDADNFYGREGDVRQIVDLVNRNPLVPIIGASGSGKSSLVYAGLIPELRKESQCKWQILEMRPSDNPFAALAQAIVNSSDRADPDSLTPGRLADSPDALMYELIKRKAEDQRMLLYIDQMEELFTRVADSAIRQQFLHSLAELVKDKPYFVLVFTLRSDFSQSLYDNIDDNHFRPLLKQHPAHQLESMTRASLKAAIAQPVSKMNVELENGLIDQLCQYVGNDAGNLSLLQLLLQELWERQKPRLLTNEAYDQICGEHPRSFLANFAEGIYNYYARQNKIAPFKQVLLRLITPGERRIPNARRITTYAEIGENNWQDIVVPLSTMRLLKTDFNRATQEATVEIIHKTLVNSWQRLTQWIETNLPELKQIDEIETAALKWNRKQRANRYLWGRNKLKEAQKFFDNQSIFLDLTPTATDFLKASRKKIRSTKFFLAGFAVIILLIGSIVYLTYDRYVSCPIDRGEVGEKIENICFRSLTTSGEKIPLTSSYNAFLKEGVEEFKKGNYDRAKDFFKLTIKSDPTDPVAQIFLNNSRARKNDNSLKVAVIVPIDYYQNAALDILRGVAYAQTQFNNRQKQSLLEIVIVNDGNKEEVAKKVAQDLTKDPSILAIIGHHFSGSTGAALSQYEQAKIAVVSPTSSGSYLDKKVVPSTGSNNVFFRATVSTKKYAEIYSKYFRENQKIKNIGIINFLSVNISNGDSSNAGYVESFSRDFENEFKKTARIMSENPNRDEIELFIHNQNIQAFFVIPSGQNNSKVVALSKLVHEINVQRQQQKAPEIELFTTISVLEKDTLDKSDESIKDMKMMIPCRNDKSFNYLKSMEKRWELKNKSGNWYWRMGYAYDSTLKITKAIEKIVNSGKKPDRQNILQKLPQIKLAQKEASGFLLSKDWTETSSDENTCVFRVKNGEFVEDTRNPIQPKS